MIMAGKSVTSESKVMSAAAFVNWKAPSSNISYIATEIVSFPGENNNKDAGSSRNELMNAIIQPAITLGIVRGTIIRKKVRRGGVL